MTLEFLSFYKTQTKSWKNSVVHRLTSLQRFLWIKDTQGLPLMFGALASSCMPCCMEQYRLKQPTWKNFTTKSLNASLSTRMIFRAQLCLCLNQFWWLTQLFDSHRIKSCVTSGCRNVKLMLMYSQRQSRHKLWGNSDTTLFAKRKPTRTNAWQLIHLQSKCLTQPWMKIKRTLRPDRSFLRPSTQLEAIWMWCLLNKKSKSMRFWCPAEF